MNSINADKKEKFNINGLLNKKQGEDEKKPETASAPEIKVGDIVVLKDFAVESPNWHLNDHHGRVVRVDRPKARRGAKKTNLRQSHKMLKSRYQVDLGYKRVSFKPANLEIAACGAPIDGDLVKVKELVGAAELNGLFGHVLSFNFEKGRFVVDLGGGMQKALRPRNVERVAKAEECFEKGDKVEAHGLKGAAELNGQAARVVGLNNKTGRYIVRWIASSTGGNKALRPQNLKLLEKSAVSERELTERGWTERKVTKDDWLYNKMLTPGQTAYFHEEEALRGQEEHPDVTEERRRAEEDAKENAQES